MHCLKVCRYVERNPLRAKLAKRAEGWLWGPLTYRMEKGLDKAAELLDDWAVERPRDWLSRVNRAERESELEALRRSVAWGQPYAEAGWVSRTAGRLGLASTLRPVGRPRLKKEA